MDRIEISAKAREMKTAEDFLSLINAIVHDEKERHGALKTFSPFEIKTLNYYRNPNHKGRYKEFQIPKKSGGMRTIDAPRSQAYQLILRAVNILIKSIYTPTEYAMGFVSGRSVATNAQRHVGQHYVFNIDLKDFFPSIQQARLWGRLQVKPFEFSQEVSSIIAGLCSIKTDDGRFVLPQGSPASPIITNIICDRLDRRLGGLAKRFGLRYTRYADDITFSSSHNVYQEGSEFRIELERIITDQHFTINPKKSRLAKPSVRQEVTGITVNQKPNVTKEYVRYLRSILHIWRRYGYMAAQNSFNRYYTEQKKHAGKKHGRSMELVVEGKLMYLKMIKGSDDAVYQHLMAEYADLVGKSNDLSRVNEKGILYIDTMPLHEFETNLGIEIKFEAREKNRFCYYQDQNGKKQLITVSSYLKTDLLKETFDDSGVKNQEKRNLVAVSTCRSRDGILFLLLHKLSKSAQQSTQVETSFAHSCVSDQVDIDALNDELDALLNNA